MQVSAGCPGSADNEADGLTAERVNKRRQRSGETGGTGERIRGGKETGSGPGKGTEQTGGMRAWNRAFLQRQELGTESGAKMKQGAQGKQGMRITG